MLYYLNFVYHAGKQDNEHFSETIDQYTFDETHADSVVIVYTHLLFQLHLGILRM